MQAEQWRSEIDKGHGNGIWNTLSAIEKVFSMVSVGTGLKSGDFDFIITTGYGAALIAMDECY